jgi:hypothetical protein
MVVVMTVTTSTTRKNLGSGMVVDRTSKTRKVRENLVVVGEEIVQLGSVVLTAPRRVSSAAPITAQGYVFMNTKKVSNLNKIQPPAPANKQSGSDPLLDWS